jgi:hypothetical protein
LNYFQVGMTGRPVIGAMLCDIDWGTRSLLGQMHHTGVVLRSLLIQSSANLGL